MARLFIGIQIPKSVRVKMERIGESNQEIQGVRWVPPTKYHVTVYYLGEVEEEMMDNLLEVIRNGFKGYSTFHLTFDRFELAPRGEKPRMIWGRWEQHPIFLQLVERAHYLYTQLNPTYSYRKRPIPHVTLARFGKEVNVKNFSLKEVKNPEGIDVQEMVLWESIRKEKGRTTYEELCRIPLVKGDL